MHFAFSSFFWGFFFILLGISLILKIIFKMRINIIKLFIAVLVISIGVKLFLKSVSPKVLSNTVILETKHFSTDNFSPNYFILFGKGELNLNNYAFSKKKINRIKILNFGGKFNLNYNINYPIEIKVNNLFSFSQLTEQNINILGKASDKTSSYDPLMEHLDIEITVIFGKVTLNR